jgi:hypothetical protein
MDINELEQKLIEARNQFNGKAESIINGSSRNPKEDILKLSEAISKALQDYGMNIAKYLKGKE